MGRKQGIKQRRHWFPAKTSDARSSRKRCHLLISLLVTPFPFLLCLHLQFLGLDTVHPKAPIPLRKGSAQVSWVLTKSKLAHNSASPLIALFKTLNFPLYTQLKQRTFPTRKYLNLMEFCSTKILSLSICLCILLSIEKKFTTELFICHT